MPLPTGQALVTTAGVTVATSDIRTAVADTLAAAQRNGASVFTADVNIGDERDDGSVDGSGFFVVKVPPADLEPLITDLGATVGRLSGRTQDTTDVTDQLVDLDNRVDLSTLTIQLQYETPVTEVVASDDSVETISDAWHAGWDVFVGALFAIGFVLAIAAPFVLTALLVLGAVWIAARRRRRTNRTGHHSSGDTTLTSVAGTVTPDEQLAGPSPRV